MALKACLGCKKEIGEGAKPCPNCGRKKPHGLSVVETLGVVMFSLFVLAAMCGRRDKDESSAPASGIAHASEEAALPIPPIELGAQQLWAAYDANEVAADNAYKGRVLAVTGKVVSIEKGILSEILVKLAADGPYDYVIATMDKSQASAAAALSKGTRLTVLGKGNGMIIGSPMLADCFFAR